MIVFDASTLILLAKVELLKLFLDDYRGEIVIPTAVRSEVVTQTMRADAIVIRQVIAEGRIGVRRIRSGSKARRLMADFALGRGEAEAIALALETSAHLVATDDRNAILACRMLGLGAVTAIAVLVRARQKRRLPQEQAERQLKQLARYGRYAAPIIEDARRQVRSGG